MSNLDTAMQREDHLVERAAELLRRGSGFGGSLGLEPASLPPVVPAPAPTITPVPATPRAIPSAISPVAANAPAELAPVVEIEALSRAGLVVGGRRTRVTEEFQITASRVLRAMRGGRLGSQSAGNAASAGNAIMVTSARPGEGKSFSALNLAASIAQNGVGDVLLVDVDPKRGSMTAQLGLADRPGVLDLAAQPNLRIEDAVLRTRVPNLSVLPVGTRGADRVEVARPISAMIERLSRRYPSQIVILDAPPCLSTSDPSTLASLVGHIVMIVEAQRTQRSEVEAAIDLVRACPSITLMLNKIQLTHSHTFGAYNYLGQYS